MASPSNNSQVRFTPVAPHLISQLERQLRGEIELQMRYAAALAEEDKVVKKFRKDSLEAHVETRSEVADRIERASQEREVLRKLIDPSNSLTITQIVSQRISKAERPRLLKLIATLRELVEKNQQKGIELGRLVQFTQTLVDGSISILRSASQPVTRSYGRNRVTVEREAPKSRGGLKITEA